jgi:hypothetical protein
LKGTIRKGLKRIDHALTRWNRRVINWYRIQHCDRAINSIIKSTSIVLDLNHPSVNEAKNYWRKYNIKLNPKWHTFFASLNNKYSSKYIPEDIFFNYIIPLLNNVDLADAYVDKNSYDVFMKGIRMPKTVLRCMHGNLYNDSYALLTHENYINSLPSEEVECFIKPALDSGQGKNIKKGKISNRKVFIDDISQDINNLVSSYQGEFIIQEGIKQSVTLSDIYPYSVNSIRPMSLRHKDKIEVLSSELKFGSNKNYVSNTKAGGVMCGVDENGNLTDFGYDKKYNKMFEHPFTHKPFKNITIPNFSELKKLIVQCHARLPHFNLIAWDFGLDNNNHYTLIEYNLLLPGLNPHQVFHGPIFEKYLDEILGNL